MLAETSKKTKLLTTKYNFLLVIMADILRNRTEIEQELILETHSDEAISSDSKSELHEDIVAADDNNNANESRDSLVKTTTSMEFRWCPCFHWSSQWTEDTRRTPPEHRFFTNFSLSSLLHGHNPTVDPRD
jgi:hypothetical protein